MRQNPTILLTGANGQVGFELRRSLAILGQVVALDRQQCDLSNIEQLRHIIQKTKPDIIVNAAAYTAVDKAEGDAENAQRINAEAVAAMAEEAAVCKATVIHYSTDYVFDGEKQGFYDESDSTNPLSIYGSSKLAGEQALQAATVPYYVFRTSWVYGTHGNNFLKTMMRLARQKEALSVVADQWGAPTGAALIADVTSAMVQQLQMGKKIDSGVYHLVAAGETNWHEYAQHVLTRAVQKGLTMKFDSQSIRAIPTSDYPTPARRPANSRLDCRKLETALGITLPHWSQGVDQVVDMLMENTAL